MMARWTLCGILFIFIFKQCTPSGFGKCPKHRYMENFELSRFVGDWYEIERSFYLMELTSSCITLHFEETDKRQLEVTVKTRGRLPIRRTLCEGIAAPSKKNPSLLLFKINSGLPYGLSNVLPGAGFYQILETDYDNFAIIWKCTAFPAFHIDSIWIFGRNREFNATLRSDIYSILGRKKIDIDRLIIPKNKNCTN